MDEVVNEGIDELIEVAFSRVQKKTILAAHYGDVLDILRDGVCDKCKFLELPIIIICLVVVIMKIVVVAIEQYWAEGLAIHSAKTNEYWFSQRGLVSLKLYTNLIL